MAYQSFYASAVAELDGDCIAIAETEIAYWKGKKARIFWSVYGYLKTSPVSRISLCNCISDHDTREDAEEITHLLNEGLASR